MNDETVTIPAVGTSHDETVVLSRIVDVPTDDHPTAIIPAVVVPSVPSGRHALPDMPVYTATSASDPRLPLGVLYERSPQAVAEDAALRRADAHLMVQVVGAVTTFAVVLVILALVIRCVL